MTKRIDLVFTLEMRKKIFQDNPDKNYDHMLGDFAEDNVIEYYMFDTDGYEYKIIFKDEDQKAQFIMNYL